MAWSNAQKAILQQYRRYAGIGVAAGHNILRNMTGHESSTHPALTQRDFDLSMALFETYAHTADLNDRGDGKPPCKGGNWFYWRKRVPAKGKVDTRQLWHIQRLWDLLQGHLPPEQQTHDYLAAIASRACGRRIAHLHELQACQASWTIEALKARLSQVYQDRNLRREDAENAVLDVVSQDPPTEERRHHVAPVCVAAAPVARAG